MPTRFLKIELDRGRPIQLQDQSALLLYIMVRRGALDDLVIDL